MIKIQLKHQNMKYFTYQNITRMSSLSFSIFCAGGWLIVLVNEHGK